MGYKKVRINGDKTRDLHRIVMERYLGRKLSYDEVVHHIDGDTSNNDIDNLELTTRREHGRMHNLNRKVEPVTRDKLQSASSGSKNHFAKLSERDVFNIRELLKSNSVEEIADMYNMSISGIEKIKYRQRWKHL